MSEPLTSVADARKLAKDKGYRAVIVIGVRDDGLIDIASYGRSKADCRVIGDYAQRSFGDNIPVAPFSTWFGAGNGGVPKAIPPAKLLGLTTTALDYIARNTHPDALASEA